MIDDILLDKFAKKRLANFYIVNCSPIESERAQVFLDKWIHQLLEKVLVQGKVAKSIKNAKAKLNFGMLDILEVRKQDERKEYINEDLEELFKFVEMSACQLTHKFIIVHEADFIPKNLSNKMLKTLEDTTKDTTIFFLHGGKSQFLPTIVSRITLAPSIKKMSEPFHSQKKLSTWLSNSERPYNEKLVNKLTSFEKKEISINDLLEFLHVNSKFELEFISIISDWISSSHDFRKKEQFLKNLEQLKIDSTFNTSKKIKFYPFVSLIA